MKLNHWIEEYRTEDGLSYNIPEYKIPRLYSTEIKLELALKALRDPRAHDSTCNFYHAKFQNKCDCFIGEALKLIDGVV